MADDKAATPQPKQERTTDQRIADLERQLAASQQRVTAMTPQSQVPANGGGLGVDHHEDSWSLAQQEAANAGDWEALGAVEK